MTRKGWYGAAEKAETFFFEHEWEPVPGHPAEVSTCNVCGLNRWSDEHMNQSAAAEKKPHGDVQYADPGYQADKVKRYPIDTADHVRSAWSYINQAGNAAKYKPADRERIKARIRGAAKRLGVDIAGESAAQLSRLEKSYGPVPTSPMAHTPEMIAPEAPDADDLPDAKDAKAVEDQAIAASKKVPAAQSAHPFMPAQFPSDEGHPRCRLCGDGTPAHADFHPEIPVAASDDSGLSHDQKKHHKHPFQAHNHTMTFGGGHFSTGVNSTYGGAYCAFCGRPANDPSHTAAPAPAAPAPAPAPATAHERLAPTLKEGEGLATPPEKAFVSEVNGKTLITGPASAFNVEQAIAGNEHMLWMQGRFVGAEKANRNGALWSTGDLEMGQASVLHGPLNWLHEARHVIGTIANAQLITRNEAADENLDQPFIEATSAIWRWIYPDEAWVVEQASDAGKLWYSMECISKNVECVGDGGCATKASYGDYLSGKGCEHMTQRSAVRRFEDPTFLGGAVIVPPVRPGWAEADAKVMRQAASMAETAFDQAGRPDMAASEWEQLMAQLVRFAAN